MNDFAAAYQKYYRTVFWYIYRQVDIGKTMHFSKWRVYQLHREALEQLRAAIL